MSSESSADAPAKAEPETAVGAIRAVLLGFVSRMRPPTSATFFRPKAIKSNSVVAELHTYGFLGAARRVMPTLMANVAAGSGLFKVYETLHSYLARPHQAADAAACGAAAGLAHAVVACPLAALCAGKWHAPFAALRVYMVRDVFGFSVFFGSWQGLHTRAVPQHGPSTTRLRELLANVAAGGAAGGLYHIWSAPFDAGQAHVRPSLGALRTELRRTGWRNTLSRAGGSARGAVLASSMSFFLAELVFEDGLMQALVADMTAMTADVL